MARELLVTLGLNATSYTNNMRRIKALTKELDKEFNLTKSSVEGFEKSLEGLAKKSEYLGTRTKYLTAQSELYLKRIHESANELEKAEKETVQYTLAIKDLQQKMKGMAKGSDEYKKANKELKGLNQLLGKAEKRVTTYNQRILDTKANYAMVETEIQHYSKELEKVGLSMQVFERTEHLDKLKQEIIEGDESFKRISNSVDNFGKTMTSLETSQQHYYSQQEKINNLMVEYTKEINKSKSEIEGYKQKIEGVKTELKEWEQLLKETSHNDSAYMEIANHVEKIRKEYSELNAVVEFYEDRIDVATTANKEFKNTLASLEGSIDKTTKAMLKLSETNHIEKLEGELKELKAQGSALDSAFDVTTSKVSKFGYTLTQLGAKEQFLQGRTKNLEEVISKLGSIATACRDKIDRLKNEQQQLNSELVESKEKLDKLNPQDVGYEELAIKVNQTEQKIKELNTEIANETNKLRGLESEIGKTTIQFNNLSRELKGLNAKKFMDELGETKKIEKLEKELQELKNKTQQLDNQFEISSSKFGNYGRTVQQLGEKKQYLINKINSLENTMNKMKVIADSYTNKITRLTKEEQKLNEKLTEQKAKLQTLNPQSVQYEKLANEIYETQLKMESLNNQISEEKQKLNGLQGEIAQTSSAFGELGRELKTIDAQFVSSKLETYGNRLRNIGQGLSSAGMAMMPVSLAVGGLGKKIIKTGSDFESQMSRVGALTGDTGAKLQKTMGVLEKGARKLAKESIFSATEVTQGLEDLVLAGYDAEKSISALPIVMQYAQAGQLDMSTATENLVTSLGSLGKNSELTGNDIDDLNILANQMAVTANATVTDIDGLAKSFIKVGGQAENLHIPLSTMGTMLGILGDKGIVAEEAGTSLNSILINLTKTGGESAKAMKQLGVSAFDSHGKIKPIEKTLFDIKKALSGLDSDKQEVILKNMLGGKTQAKTLMKLLQGISLETGGFDKRYKSLQEELSKTTDPKTLKNADTALKNMADAMNDNLAGDWKYLQSAIEEFCIAVFKDLNPALRETVQNLTKLVNNLTEGWKKLSPEMKQFIFGLSKFIVLSSPVLLFLGGLIRMAGNMAFALKSIVDFFGIFKKASEEVGTAGEIVEQSTNKYSKIIDALSKVSNKIKTVIMPSIINSIRSCGTRIGTALSETLIPAFSGAISSISTTVGEFITATLIPTIGGALSGIGTTIGSALAGVGTVILEVLGGVATFISGYWIPIVIGLAIAGLVALIVKYWEQIKEKTKQMWDSLSKYLADLWKNIKDKVSEMWSHLCEQVAKVKDNIIQYFKELPNKIMEILNSIIDNFIKWKGILIGTIGGIFVGAFANLCIVFKGIFKVVEGLFTILEGIFTLNIGKIEEGIMQIATAIGETLRKFIHNSWETITTAIDNFAQQFSIKFKEMADGTVQWCGEMIDKFIQWGMDMGSQICTSVSEWGTNLVTGLENMWNDFCNWCDEMTNKLIEWGMNFLDTTIENFLQWATNIADQLTYVKDHFGEWVEEWGISVLHWIDNTIEKTLDGLTSWANHISERLDYIINHFDEWSDEWINKLSAWALSTIEKGIDSMCKFGKSIQDGFNDIVRKAQKWCGDFLSALKNLPSKLYNFGKKMVSSIWDGFKSKWNDFKGWVSSSFHNITKNLVFDAEVKVKNSNDLEKTKLPTFNVAPTVQTPMTTGNTTGDMATNIGSNFKSLISFGATSNPFTSLFKETFDVSNFKVGAGEFEKQAVKIESSKQNRSETDSKLVDMLIQQNQLLMQLLTADRTVQVGVNVDGRQIAKASAKYMESEINTIKNRNSRLGGAF